jgi:hypothetical protein
VHADLDTLVTALYVTIDDLLGPRRGPGRPPRLTDAELVCLAVAQVLLGFGSERRWLRFAGRRLGHLFPYLPTASAYNRRLRRAAGVVTWPLTSWPGAARAGGTTCAWSTPPRCRARPAARRSSVRRWPGMPATATARATTAGSGAFGCMCWPPRTGCRSRGAWPHRSWESARSWQPCSTTSAAGCGPGWSSLATRASPGRSSSDWSQSMEPGCCVPTVPTSPAGAGR